MSQSWAPSVRSPSFPGEKSPPHKGSQLARYRLGPTQGCRGAGCALPSLGFIYWLQPHSRDGAPSPGDTILGATVLENRAQIFTW